MTDLQHGSLPCWGPAVTPRSVFALPTEPYLGLTLPEALARAADEGRLVRVFYRPGFRSRANQVFRRLTVVLDDEGRVAAVKAG